MIGNVMFFEWEVAVQVFLQSIMPDFMVKVLGFITEFGDVALLIAIMGLYYWGINKDVGKKVLLTLCFAAVFNPMIKNIVLRLRPYMVHKEVKCLKAVEPSKPIDDVAGQGYSFPSGHATNAISAYTGMIFFTKGNRLWKVLGIVIPLLVGLSRVVLGVHYVTDVLFGWLLGGIFVLMAVFLGKTKKSRTITMIVTCVVGIAGFFYCTSDDFFTGYGMLVAATIAVPFEEKFVNFQESKSVLRVILRVLGGVMIYLALNSGLKLVFPQTDDLLVNGILRSVRYCIIVFLLIGVYPLLFRVTAKIGKKKETEQIESIQA